MIFRLESTVPLRFSRQYLMRRLAVILLDRHLVEWALLTLSALVYTPLVHHTTIRKRPLKARTLWYIVSV